MRDSIGEKLIRIDGIWPLIQMPNEPKRGYILTHHESCNDSLLTCLWAPMLQNAKNAGMKYAGMRAVR